MLTKSILAAAALAVAVPFGAFAAGQSAGHVNQAGVLGLNASDFTSVELAQIAAEHDDERQARRANFILAQKSGASNSSNAGHNMQAAILGLDPAEFTTNELAQIAAARNDERRENERTKFIQSQKNAVTVSTSGVSGFRATAANDEDATSTIRDRLNDAAGRGNLLR